jgi:putative transposase
VCRETLALNLAARNLFRDVLDVPANEALRRETVREIIQGSFQLQAFVAMPEPVHLLITPSATLERAVQLIKGGYSHAFGAEFGRKKEIWQRGFTDHRIRDRVDFELHRGYIHQNPVKRGLVQNASEYRYCSAYPGFKLDGWPTAAKARFD